MIADLVRKTRTYRRFHQERAVEEQALRELVDLGRLSASGGNVQSLKYMISCDPEKNATIFPHLKWAGYLKDWAGPDEGERPAAYVVILLDKDVSKGSGVDHGIAAQSIALGACERGLGCCMIGSIEREALRSVLSVPDRYDILLVLALGEPKEQVVIEDVGPDGDIKYYRDEDGVHHLPKRSLDDVIVG